MSTFEKISPDDPRLTAYALDEMEPAERAEFELLLKQDAAARATVAEINGTAHSIGVALASEPVPQPGAPMLGQAAIIPGRDLRKHDGGPAGEVPGLRRGLAKVVRFPQIYFAVSGLAAACFALFFTYWSHTQPVLDQKKYVEVDLAKMAPSEANKEPTDKSEMVDALALASGDEVESLKESVGFEPRLQAPPALMERPASLMVARIPVLGAEAGSMMPRQSREQPNTETYAQQDENPFLAAGINPLSTFSVDVDTAAYSNVRRFLVQGQRPPRDAVRIEELVNYFPYRYAPPEVSESRGEVSAPPFAAHLEVASAPWAPTHRLVRIGLKGREVSAAARPPANLVFLLDVSGSMDQPNKLPLVKQSMQMLLGKLRPDDHVAIVVYAGASGLALPSTSAGEKTKILAAIDELRPGGSTNGAAGIQLAYDIAKANFVTGGLNRVILATDGDFNVGVTGEGELTRLIEEKAKTGVFLSVFGFGMGNYKDASLEKLADKGNGNYAYIDTAAEAKKALVEQAGGTLMTIAKDVKLQVEFNPLEVQSYRLIGYENRMLRKEDFNNDKIDAGEIGAGHTVTALYEVVPVSAETPVVDALKYQRPAGPVLLNHSELLTLKVRYKEPTGDVSSKLEFPLRDSGRSFEQASADFKFAASVAAFGMILRDSPHKGKATFASVTQWAQAGLVNDAGGYRAEFVGLVGQAERLMHN